MMGSIPLGYVTCLLLRIRIRRALVVISLPQVHHQAGKVLLCKVRTLVPLRGGQGRQGLEAAEPAQIVGQLQEAVLRRRVVGLRVWVM